MPTAEMVHVVDSRELHRALTDEQRSAAKRYIGDIPADDPIIAVYDGPTSDEDKKVIHIEFRRTECARLIDWFMENPDTLHHTAVSSFIVSMTEKLAEPIAMKLIQRLRIPREFRRKALPYFSDAIAANAVGLLMGATHKKIVKVESVRPVSVMVPETREFTRKDGRVETVDRETEQNLLFVNEEFPIQCKNLELAVPEFLLGKYTILTESSRLEGVFNGGSVMEKRSSLIQIALAFARANHVSLEVGRASHRTCQLIREHADSKMSAKPDSNFDMVAAEESFLDYLDQNEIVDVQERTIFAVECDRAPTMVARMHYAKLNKQSMPSWPTAFEFYQDQTLDKPHKSSYYRALAKVQSLFKAWLDENWEDVIPKSEKRTVPATLVGTPKPKREPNPRAVARDFAAKILMARSFGKRLADGISFEPLNVELSEMQINGLRVPVWSAEVEVLGPVLTRYTINGKAQETGIVYRPTIAIALFTDVVTGCGDGI